MSLKSVYCDENEEMGLMRMNVFIVKEMISFDYLYVRNTYISDEGTSETNIYLAL